jgi:hypothetical protein
MAFLKKLKRETWSFPSRWRLNLNIKYFTAIKLYLDNINSKSKFPVLLLTALK